jgi:GNAT superfamily N-acetyltransferase
MPATLLRSPEQEAMLYEVASSPVGKRWYPFFGDKAVELSLPHDCEYGGRLDLSEDGELVMNRHSLRVNQDLRGAGIGSRLVSALARISLENGARRLNGFVLSQYAITIVKDLFGEDNISFEDDDQITDERVSLPMTIDQAFSSLERAEGFERDPEDREHGFYMSIDLSGFKASDFEPTVKVM